MGNKSSSHDFKVDSFHDGPLHEFKLHEEKMRFQYVDPSAFKDVKQFRVENLKRANSLPLSGGRKSGSKCKVSENKSTNPVQTKPAYSVQGYDQIRSYLGQKDKNDTQLNDLVMSITLLYDKLADLRSTQQDCVQKLLEFKQRCEHDLCNSRGESKASALFKLRLFVADNFLSRIDNLLQEDQEPFMVDVKHFLKKAGSKKGDPISASSVAASSPAGSGGQSAEEKRQQIKDIYDHLIRSITPQLYGSHFEHRSNHEYRKYETSLCELRERVRSIPSQSEQQLVDAKRIFLQETELYLRTLQQMVQCDEADCVHCTKC